MKKNKPNIVNIGEAWRQYAEKICQCQHCQDTALRHFTAGATAFHWNLNALTARGSNNKDQAVDIGTFMKHQGRDIDGLYAQIRMQKDQPAKH